MLCPNCNEMILRDARQADECMVHERNSKKIVPCPCCYGWGEHIEGSNTGARRVCSLCKGRRMVVERVIYEVVPEIKKADAGKESKK